MNANVMQRKAIGQGVTNSERATLSDGQVKHDAHIQTIDLQKNAFTSKRGTELNFKDSYKFNIAAYRLDKILGLNMIPVSVERKVGERPARSRGGSTTRCSTKSIGKSKESIRRIKTNGTSKCMRFGYSTS